MSLTRIISMVTITSIIYSQAMYVSDNNNYFGISCLYSSESDPTGSESFTGANLNYILGGAFEVGVGYGISNYINDDDDALDMDGSGLSLSGNYHFKNKLPINIAINGNYSSRSFNSELLDENDLNATASGVSFGIKFYKGLYKNGRFEFTPFVEIHKMDVTAIIKDEFGDSIEEDEKNNILIIGIGLKNGNVIFEPKVLQIDGEINFAFSLGFVLPQNLY